jgi:class 3 adenylate cyclase
MEESAPAAPPIEYAPNGDRQIAYQVLGHGPVDLLEVNTGLISIDFIEDEPHWARYQRRLAAFARVIRFDLCGVGLSDPPLEQRATLDDWMSDALAVLDAAGSERAAVIGTALGAPPGVLLAATHPGRVSHLVLIHGYARARWAPDYPWGRSEEDVRRLAGVIDPQIPDPVDDVAVVAPSLAGDKRFRSWWRRAGRLSASPQRAASHFATAFATDLRSILGTVAVPTLVIHRRDNAFISIDVGRDLVARIPGARLVELPGSDHLPYAGDGDAVTDVIEEFVTGNRPVSVPDRILSTIVFTDIVRSTERAVTLGDLRWRELLEEHAVAVRREIERFRGREVKSTGDGFLVTFDGPARAAACACAIRDAARDQGITIRAGVHTGEVDMRGGDVTGIAVHIAARIAGIAAAGEVLVSRTVQDLVAGSSLRFADRGVHELRGVGKWALFAAEPPDG